MHDATKVGIYWAFPLTNSRSIYNNPLRFYIPSPQRQPSNRMSLIEWPRRDDNGEGKGCPNQTESQGQFDILFEEANKEGDCLSVSVSILQKLEV